MRTLSMYQKAIGLLVLVSLYGLCMPLLPAQAAMVTTENSINRGSKVDFDRARIKVFVSRKDVVVRLQSYGISAEEALARVDSLTDEEIALIADKLNQLPAGGDTYSTIAAIGAVIETAQYVYYGAILAAIIIYIVLYIVFEVV